MRRFLSSILAILVLVLSCLPCSDANAIPLPEGMPLTLRSADAGHHCGDGDAHACSPFCTCSCCAGIALPVPVHFPVGMATRLLARPVSLWPAGFFPEVHLPIWQPPRLG